MTADLRRRGPLSSLRGWRAPLAATVTVAVLAAVVVAVRGEPLVVADAGVELTGRVLDERGDPVVGAVIAAGEERARTDAEGAFAVAVTDRPQLVRASADDHLSRVQAVQAGTPSVIRLASGAEETVSLRFGGDTMFGRRFYDRDEDGDRRDGLLPLGADVDDHLALLEPVAPLLADADLTVVNLETPLTDDVLAGLGARPPGFHPTKDIVFTSAPESADALVAAGVDVVALGNNHVYDALDDGLASTLAAVEEAGLVAFGAGLTIDAAWEPAFVERKGQVVAFVGCTTVEGDLAGIPYVATGQQGGAAACDAARLALEVAAAGAAADTVVVMLHGGVEYVPTQTEEIRALTRAATAAGADLVVNSHPHVVGGITAVGSTVVAESMGNLVFDQDLWPTFLSYLLRADVRAGEPVLATVDPLLLEDYVPRPTVGGLANAASRTAAGTIPSDAQLRWWAGSQAAQEASLGRDLLWRTGSFEDLDTDPTTAPGHLWSLGRFASLSEEAACAGSLGAVLLRSPLSSRDVVVTPEHRQLVAPGTRLSLLAAVRDASPGAVLELRWYKGLDGPSSASSAVRVPPGSYGDACRLVRVDAVVPPGITTVRPFVRLAPPDGVLTRARLAVDDVQLVAWAEPGVAGRLWDTISGQDSTTLPLRADTGPAATAPAGPLAELLGAGS